MADTEFEDPIICFLNYLSLQPNNTTEQATGEADLSVEAEISDVSDIKSNKDKPDATTKPPLPEILLLIGLLSKYIYNQDLIISSNNYGRLIINEIREHALMPDYPATKDSQSLKNPDILYFIYYLINLIPEEIPANKISSIFTKKISQHNSSLALHPFSLLYQLNSNKAGVKVWHCSYTYTIFLKNWDARYDKNYMAQLITSTIYRLDKLYLKYLVEKYSFIPQPKGTCCFMAPTTTGLTKCDQAHEGQHAYPLPPPICLPKIIADKVLKVLEREECITLTAILKYYIILCYSDTQANLFQETEFIQINLSFKIVNRKTNVFSISGWCEEHQGISETGIYAISADIYIKQGPGLGDYLHDIYKTFTWDNHKKLLKVIKGIKTGFTVAKYTNISKSSYFQDNHRTSQGLSLLGAILWLQYNPMLSFDSSNPYNTLTPLNSIPLPRAEEFNDNSLVVSSLIYARHISNIQALSILSTTSSFQEEGSSASTLQLSQQGRKRQLRQESVDILASQVQQAREQARKIELENERKRAELKLLKAEKESKELDRLLAAARQE
ncbi:hypothetical protein BDW59DRAFT_153131 [Aspergillus cavernicola]|uniref:Uncharacterized protein n=1 Tax=Aspergillus cavernicola TaxID=176166 RepID=A0ABR4HM68_9EURO